MITYQNHVDDVTPAQLAGFFVGWPNPPAPETHLRLLQNSRYRIVARSAAGRVIGFITAISDDVLSAYIPLLEVLPEYQRQGIGGELLERMLAQLRHLYMVDLLCDAELQPYYRRFGMQPYQGMLYRNYDRQAGN